MVDDTLMSDAEAAARALLDRRIELIRELTAATTELEPLQRAAAQGEQRVRDAWAEALAGGWTAEELRSLGVPEPDRKPTAKKTAPKPRGNVAAPAPGPVATPAPTPGPVPAAEPTEPSAAGEGATGEASPAG
ncbi:hypothetical protein GCM10023205_75680 [Yinghuangia aomiensis]|uniref:Uncharacterized protein n=1 Tax=Yinghuangia aomiensis TaxID=676205 RepID=A0ABP9IAG2_9ACTN